MRELPEYLRQAPAFLAARGLSISVSNWASSIGYSGPGVQASLRMQVEKTLEPAQIDFLAGPKDGMKFCTRPESYANRAFDLRFA